MATVQQNGLVLYYVIEQTEAICMAAVQKTGWALDYVKQQTEAICMAAVQETRDAIKYIDRTKFAISRNYKKPQHHLDDVCSICLEHFDNTTIETNCKHQFHRICLDRIRSLQCPMCRLTNEYSIWIVKL